VLGDGDDEFNVLTTAEEVWVSVVDLVLDGAELVDHSSVDAVETQVVREPEVKSAEALLVTRHEQADETSEGEPWHWEGKGEAPVDAVFCVAVYVAQNGARILDERMSSRRQLLWLQAFLATRRSRSLANFDALFWVRPRVTVTSVVMSTRMTPPKLLIGLAKRSSRTAHKRGRGYIFILVDTVTLDQMRKVLLAQVCWNDCVVRCVMRSTTSTTKWQWVA
jgi:hypothetical protein